MAKVKGFFCRQADKQENRQMGQKLYTQDLFCFPTVFSKDLIVLQARKKQGLFGKGFKKCYFKLISWRSIVSSSNGVDQRSGCMFSDLQSEFVFTNHLWERSLSFIMRYCNFES